MSKKCRFLQNLGFIMSNYLNYIETDFHCSPEKYFWKNDHPETAADRTEQNKTLFIYSISDHLQVAYENKYII